MKIPFQGFFLAIIFYLIASPSYGYDAVDIAYTKENSWYKEGYKGPDEFDCSGLTQYAFGHVGVSLPDGSWQQAPSPEQEVGFNDLLRGDLLFFDADKDEKIDHVAIFVSKNKMIHSTWNEEEEDRGWVRESDITSWWRDKFVTARRLHPSGPSTTFSVGDEVQVISARGLIDWKDGTWEEVSGGERSVGDKGRIDALPIFYGGEWRWSVNFDDGKDGWIRESYIEKVGVVVIANLPFTDNFNDNSIDPTLWEYRYAVSEVNGQLHLDTVVTDRVGNAWTAPLTIDPRKPLKISRMVKVYAANDYYMGSMVIDTDGHPEYEFGVSYSNYSYRSSRWCPRYGFSLYRNAVSSASCAAQTTDDLSDTIPSIWNTWFKEDIWYNPRTGALGYSINNNLRLVYNVGRMPSGADTISIYFDDWGWWTGHKHYMDDLSVTQ